MEGLQPTIDIGGNNNGMGNWGGALIGGAIGGAVGSACCRLQSAVCSGLPELCAGRYHRRCGTSAGD